MAGRTVDSEGNGDCQDDYVFQGDTHSYLVFGPMELSGIERIDYWADVVIDHNVATSPI